MFKDQIIREINKLPGADRMEIAINILKNVLVESGVASSEPVVMEMLEESLANLRKE